MSSGQAPASGPASAGNGSSRSVRVLVTGATGTTGTRLVPLLVAAGYDVVAASRGGGASDGASGVHFDWHDPAGHAAALDGVELMYLIPPVRDPQPELAMLPFLRLAREAGVRRAVLHEGYGTDPVKAALPSLFDEWATMRPSWFMQNFVGAHPYAEMIRRTSSIPTATGDARVGFVDASDIASVAAATLAATVPANAALELTGPEALSFADVARILSEVSGRTISHKRVTREELVARYVQIGLDQSRALFVAGMDAMIASGSVDRVTDTVETVTGVPPRSFAEFAHAEFK